MSKGQFYDHRAAAKFLGVHPKTLEHRVMRGLITPERMVNGDRIYTQEMLEKLKETMNVNETEVTMQEVADKYGINYYRVYRAIRIRRQIEPERYIGKIPLYDREQVEMIARLEEWVELETEVA